MKKTFFLFLLFAFVAVFPCLLWAAGSDSGEVRLRVFEGVWEEWDDCDSHKWGHEAWGGTDPVLTWTTFDSRDCLQVYFSTGPKGSIRTDWAFYPEDWTALGVTEFKADIYCVDYAGADLKLEVKNSTDGAVGSALWANNIPSNAWYDVSWTIVETSTHVARAYIAFEDLPATPVTFYVDNMRLLRGSTTDYWDNMDDESRKWYYAGDAKSWPTYDAITHNQYTSTSPACSVFIDWDSNHDGGTDSAEAKADFSEDWSAYGKIRANYYCSSTNAALELFFYDGSTWLGTTQQTVSSANTWETLEWELPSGLNLSTMQTVSFIVKTNTVSTGKVYIDDIQLYK